MRLLLLLIILLLPQLSRAQLSHFESGSYILADSGNVPHKGLLKLRGSNLLLVKDAAGKTTKFSPAQVSSFRLEAQKFTSIGGFHVKGGLGGLDVEKAFVEQLDSGQVMLLTYGFQVGSPMSMGAGGGMTGGGSSSVNALLLQWPGEETAVPAQGGAYSSGGKNFREAVRPFLIGRPDLLKLLDEKRINLNNLQAAIHALNHNLPFTPPAALNLE